MNKRNTKTMLKAMGATFAVCSAAAMMGASKSGTMSAKKTMKKTAQKVTDFVDTLSAFM